MVAAVVAPIVSVVGAGALGSMVAARLANAGVATKLVLRAGSPRWRAVDDGHLRVHVSGAAPMTSFVAAASDAADADVVVLATKVWQARDALLAATPPPTAPVVVLSNGALALLDEIPGVAAAATTHGCFETAAFQTTHAGAGTIWVADAKAHGVFSRVEALNSTLVSSDEMTARLWRKLAANCVLNPLTAIKRCNNGAALATEADRATARAVVEELAAVADGLVDAEDLYDAVVDCAAENAENFSSMYQDCRLGRPTEVDFLSGWVVARARARGSDAPENARLADAVRGLEAW